MIHIISLDTYIHKIVRGMVNDENQFHPLYTTYEVRSDAIEISRYLSLFHVRNKSYGFCCPKTISFLDSEVSFYPVESSVENEVRITLTDEEDYYYEMQGIQPIYKEQDILNCRILFTSTIRLQDTIIFSLRQSGVNILDVYHLYHDPSFDTCKMCMILHPSYYDILQSLSCEILIINADTFKKYYKLKVDIDLYELIAYIKYYTKNYAKHIVVSMKSNHILYFKEHEVYEAKHHIQDAQNKHYESAIASAIYMDDFDILRNMISFSVASSLSLGMYTSNKTVIEMIKKEVVTNKIM